MSVLSYVETYLPTSFKESELYLLTFTVIVEVNLSLLCLSGFLGMVYAVHMLRKAKQNLAVKEDSDSERSILEPLLQDKRTLTFDVVMRLPEARRMFREDLVSQVWLLLFLTQFSIQLSRG